MKYRIYIDEVGNSDLESSENPNHRFLSLTGVILDLEYVQSTIFPEIEALKWSFFHSHPDEPIILHRKEMVNHKYPFEVLKEPSVKEAFNSELLKLLDAWDYTVISVCIDKKKHKDTYHIWRYDPYHYCLAVLMERYYFFLNERDARGDVMAESRGGKEDMRLKQSFSNLWQNGSNYIPASRFQNVLTSKQLKVKAKSNNVAGLQLADLLAHPSRNEILKENGFFEKDLPPFGKAISNILQRKYYQQRETIFGKKFL